MSDILAKYGSDAGRLQHITSNGRLSGDGLSIELPNTFNFNGDNITILLDINPIQPVIPSQWPTILEPLKLLAREGDKGMGDIVDREIAKVNSEKYKHWFQGVFGQSCKCTWSKEYLNMKYPLDSKTFNPTI